MAALLAGMFAIVRTLAVCARLFNVRIRHHVKHPFPALAHTATRSWAARPYCVVGSLLCRGFFPGYSFTCPFGIRSRASFANFSHAHFANLMTAESCAAMAAPSRDAGYGGCSVDVSTLSGQMRLPEVWQCAFDLSFKIFCYYYLWTILSVCQSLRLLSPDGPRGKLGQALPGRGK